MSKPFHLCPDLSELHLHERLNYVLGQVLGVKDFQQEQVYFLHKARLHNRSLHGYGTVWGLDVSTEVTDEDIEIRVAPGFALDTQGREVWVDALQCAKLNAWLTAAVEEGAETSNLDTLTPIGEDSSTLAVYVTLCYRPCKTNAQPILGNPCRTDSGEEGVIQYTRIRDDFELQLRSQPPLQHEENWVRAMADVLALIEIDAEAEELTPEEQTTLEQTLRNSIDDPASIDDLEPFTVPGNQAEDILRELFRYWVTNTRPTLDLLHNPVLRILEKIEIDPEAEALEEDALAAQLAAFTDALDSYIETKSLDAIDALESVTVAPETSAALRRDILQYWASQPDSCKTTEDDCILLAAVQFELTPDNTADETTLLVENLQRPYLLHTRLLQELILKGGFQGAQGAQGPRGPRGLRGQQGEPGNDADITIGTVTTGAPGSDASVTNSGTPTNAILDFVIPRGSPGEGGTGTSTEVTVGETTTGAPGSEASVTNSGTATNVVLDFTIPQGERGTRGTRGLRGPAGIGLDQLILRPVDMLVVGRSGPPENLLNPELTPAEFSPINGYPALAFSQNRNFTSFSTLRPTSLEPGQVPLLELYCTAQETQVFWEIHWRWLRSLAPGEPLRQDARLTTTQFLNNSNNLLQMELQRFHLHRSEPVRLALTEDVEEPDYLVVHLVPRTELGREEQLYLLMAQLRWEV
ncbi:MAG: hypothetical protein AAF821_13550 [Cyanobacteria bacterium P01_D01_bin.156]